MKKAASKREKQKQQRYGVNTFISEVMEKEMKKHREDLDDVGTGLSGSITSPIGTSRKG